MRYELLDWSDRLAPEEWALYGCVLAAVRGAGITTAVGGGLAWSSYARRWRDTKDVDLYVLPQEREALIAVVEAQGFADFHDQQPYDRAWIWRGCRDGRIVDVIWQMANRRAEIDRRWLEAGPEITVHGVPLRLLPPEELLWAKLYVLQRERSDWPDILNLLDAMAGDLDWDRLLARVGDDAPLLGALLTVFGWLRPELAARVPAGAWEGFGCRPPSPAGAARPSGREGLLDTRDWFGADAA